MISAYLGLSFPYRWIFFRKSPTSPERGGYGLVPRPHPPWKSMDAVRGDGGRGSHSKATRSAASSARLEALVPSHPRGPRDRVEATIAFPGTADRVFCAWAPSRRRRMKSCRLPKAHGASARTYAWHHPRPQSAVPGYRRGRLQEASLDAPCAVRAGTQLCGPRHPSRRSLGGGTRRGAKRKHCCPARCV